MKPWDVHGSNKGTSKSGYGSKMLTQDGYCWNVVITNMPKSVGPSSAVPPKLRISHNYPPASHTSAGGKNDLKGSSHTSLVSGHSYLEDRPIYWNAWAWWWISSPHRIGVVLFPLPNGLFREKKIGGDPMTTYEVGWSSKWRIIPVRRCFEKRKWGQVPTIPPPFVLYDTGWFKEGSL